MEITPRLLMALYNLRNNSDFEVVREALEAQKKQNQDAMNRSDDPVKIFRFQGAILTFEDLFETQDKAHEHLQRIKENESKQRGQTF